MKSKPKAARPVTTRVKIEPQKLEAPAPAYHKPVKAVAALKEFTYREFKKIADSSPFTQTEWASMLHISERTLQRYAKNNSSFAPINAERALELQNVLKRGKEVFGSIEKFYTWIKNNPYMLEGRLSFESFTTAAGIQLILTQLGRIEHGILA